MRTREGADERCLRRFELQSGVISRTQALEEGLTKSAVRGRLEKKLWVCAYPGVYALGGVSPTWLGRLWAATLHLGPTAVVSHRAAARIHKLDGIDGEYVEVTVVEPGARARGRIKIHSSLTQPASRLVQGLPVTTIERTLVDLGAVCDEESVEIALDCALRRGRTSIRKLEAELEKRRGRGNRGCGVLAEILLIRGRCGPTGSALETKVARAMRAGHLPAPIRQFAIFDGDRHVATPDFAYPKLKVAVEALGYEPHGNRPAWEKDFARHNMMTPLGWRVFYATNSDLKRPEERICAPIRELLAQAAG